MFEEGFGEFGFEFQGESEDGKFYCDSVPEFQMLTKFLPLEETGLSFSGEVLLDDNTSVITDKQVKMNSPEDSVKTYLKVMEMRDLSEAEIKHISKYKLFFTKLFEVFFKNQKFRVYLTCYWLLFLGFEIAIEDYLMSFIYVAAIALYNSPIKFAKEIKKMISSKKRKEELKEELGEKNLVGLIYSIPEDEGIQLYFKPKAPNM